MTATALAELVTEGAQINAEVAALKPKSDRLDEIKEALRKHADGADSTFTGIHGETVSVSHPRDGIARYIRGTLLPKVLKLAGRKRWRFFQVSPIPAKELATKDFRVEVYEALPKDQARELLEAVTVPATPRVTFA